MVLAGGDLAAPRQACQKSHVRALVERIEFQPFLQMRGHFVGIRRQLADELFQNGGVPRAEATALRDQPAVEMRAAVDLQPVEEVADE